MHPNEIHHIKAYIVFSILSAALIGLLIYLYLPMGGTKSLGSSVIKTETPQKVVQTVQPPVTSAVSQEPTVADSEVSGRRMRLTQILIRTQKELQTLEDQRKSSPQGLDPVAEQKIVKLREKIATIEKTITDIK